MREMDIKNKMTSLIVILIIVALSVFALIGFSDNNVPYVAASDVNSINMNFDSDNIAGTDLTIRDYPSQLHATRAAVTFDNSDVGYALCGLNEDDPIVKIVSKDYFFTEGQVLNMGDEYGYYIKTKRNLSGNYSSTVLVFDITTNSDLVATTDRVIVEVSPVFQYKYVGLTNFASSEFFHGLELSYNTLASSRIVAYPSKMQNGNVLEFEMTEDYYLKDVSFGASLYNEQALNRGDSGYDPYKDYGSYFTGFDYSYQGKYREYGEFNGEDFAWRIASTINFGLGFMKGLPVIGTIATGIGQIYSIVSLGKGWVDFGVDTYNAFNGEIKTAENKITATCFYQNRDDQLKYYKDENGASVLVKTATVVADTDQNQSMWYGVGDNVTAYFNIGHSAFNGRTPNYTRFTNQLALQIVSSDGDSVVTAGSTIIQDNLRESETKELEFLGSGEIYMLPEGEDHLRYENLKYESDYTVDIALTDIATVDVNGQKKIGNNLSFTVHAEEYDDIVIDLMDNTAGLNGTVSISPNDSNTINSISANGEYLLKTDLEGIKDLQLSNTNLEIKNIYLLENEQLVSYESYVQFTSGNSITYPFEAGQAYYFVIANNSSSAVNDATLQVDGIQSFESDQEIALSKGIKAISFTNTYDKAMSFQIVLTEENSANKFSVFNKAGISIAHATTFVRDNVDYIKYSFALSAGEECYIFCSLVNSLSFTVSLDNTYVKWEIDGDIHAGYDIQLRRGESYDIRLLYRENDYAYELKTGYNYDAKYDYYTFTDNTLTINYAVPYVYVITIVPLKYPDATLRITPIEGREDINYKVTFDKTGGNGGTSVINANYNREMPSATKPSRTGYTFMGYFSEQNGRGTKYYDSNMKSVVLWDKEEEATVYAYWQANTYSVTFDKNGGGGGDASISVTYGERMPYISLPTRAGYNFLGYYTSPNGGTCYYDFFDPSEIDEYYYYLYFAKTCDFAYNATLYARWESMTWNISVQGYLSNSGYVTFPDSDAYPTSLSLTYGQSKIYYAPGIINYDFARWALTYTYGTIATGYDSRINLTNLCKGNYENYTLTLHYNFNPNRYTENGIEIYIKNKINNTWKIVITNRTGQAQAFEYNSKMCYAGDAQNWKGLEDVITTKTLSDDGSITVDITENYTATSIAISYMDGVYRKIFYAYDLNASSCTMSAFASTIDTSAPPDECIAAGTLITLADGTQVPVEELTGNEMLLVWNMQTGTYDVAPIMFIDSDPIGHYEVIQLSFSDGTSVDVIYEHGFWDFDLNKYVYLDANAAEYIGHRFNKQTVKADGTMGWKAVTLTGVEISTEVTTAYSPVTYGHLCYYVNGMLSMPGGITGLFNIFEIDEETMTIDAEDYLEDIEEYGLYTYAEFYEMYPVSEDVFEAFNGRYLKVAIGKGLITNERIGALIDRYSEFF